jgi:signal transduction histidine kinase
VRNPLASLSVAIQELMRGLDVPAERKDLVNVIRYEVGRIDRIIEEFMTLSRIRPPAIRLAAVRGVVEEAVSLLSHTEEAVANKSEIEIDVPFDLTMRLDADHLRQILLNVGLNSLQAGSKRVTIRARSTGANGAGIIEVIDNGPGMPKEVLDRMFEPFFTTRTRGTGLGCSVVRKMVEDHQGRVEVESEPGKGTLFRIFFPGNVVPKECADAAEET